VRARLKTCFLCGLMVLAARSTVAQQASPTRRTPCGSLNRFADPPGQLVHVVIGEPYSAVVETEFTHTLEDGTRIDQKNSDAHQYRDSAGRTRMEHRPIALPVAASSQLPITIMIDDPVALKSYILEPRNQVAIERDAPELGERTIHRKNPPSPIGTPGIQPFGSDDRPRPQFTSEDLGTQIIDGLEAVGTREMTTYPTGFQGNDRPFAATRETWCSVDLRVVVLNKMDNPQSGQTIIRLTNIDRSEPDPSLFQVPADYTVTQQKAMTIHPMGTTIIPLP